MSFVEVVRTAIGNTFRSRLRTILTILAIFVGAFTLTLTNGLGTGITRYVNSQLASLGGSDLMTVMKASSQAGGGGFGPSASGPVEYDPDKAFIQAGPGFSFEALTDVDLERIRTVSGVVSVEPLRMVGLDYVAYGNGTKYEVAIDPAPTGLALELVAGARLSADGVTSVPGHDVTLGELLLPVSFVEPLGFAGAESAVGEVVTLALSDAFGRQHEVQAAVVGVKQTSLFGDNASVSPALLNELFSAQTTGLPEVVTNVYQSATARLSPNLSAAQVADVKSSLQDAGLAGITLADQLGSFNTIVNTIIGVLNAFAVIALIAAGFGIINTLLMSVQERTREIGLMKALGMGAGKIFALFSTEAVFIGFLGSAIGALAAIGLGTVISEVLASGVLADLAGLKILSFDPLSVLGVTLLVMLIAFLAGTLPANRAARLDPIEALRYE